MPHDDNLPRHRASEGDIGQLGPVRDREVALAIHIGTRTVPNSPLPIREVEPEPCMTTYGKKRSLAFECPLHPGSQRIQLEAH